MIAIAYSSQDVASRNAGLALRSIMDLQESDHGICRRDNLSVISIEGSLLSAENLDRIGADLIIFLSRHSSSSGVPALTVHSTGNWGIHAKFGGVPHNLSTAAPSSMLAILRRLAASKLRMEKTYEATHHGPALSTPSIFAEFGGDQATITDRSIAAELGSIVYETAMSIADRETEYKKVVIGIGGNHYPRIFTKLAVEKGYAFSHIMPKHAIINDDGTDNIGMLEQALERSSERAEGAAIDWKSLNSGIRSDIIRKLDSIGLGYERV